MKQNLIPKWTRKDYRPVFEVGDTNAPQLEAKWEQEHRVSSLSPPIEQAQHQSRHNDHSQSPRHTHHSSNIHRGRIMANVSQDIAMPTHSGSNLSSLTPQIDRNLNLQQINSVSKSNHGASFRSNPHGKAAMNVTTSSLRSNVHSHMKAQVPLAYRSINKFNQTMRSNTSRIIEAAAHPNDPELLCTEKVLP